LAILIDPETVAEARLVAEALAGSQAAFAHLVRRYERPVVRLIARITGARALAEDLAQETFVKAFRNLAAFDPARRLSSWLFRIAHNTALDALRRARPPTVSLSDTSQSSAGGSHEPAAAAAPDPVERDALRTALLAALGELRPEHRAAVALRYEEGLSFDEIGQILGISEVTARSHVHRARKALRHKLTEAGWVPPR
jgi:RNA polymerase sigma-70 factor (ECF subfamily)